ncbi:GNAT family N-acetyltransferase [Paenibacillus hemerocallicola]|uniref:GNAT family N-acetyltransferase n=1 Tax=Paenibacillus hemerocallicola TaxID=1172614 RepID=A0A5C4TDD6_9BACL|nr:GNAT family N-acetyltransferase [Paenibacillus hemerocallicola]TNJ67094.1 GNAT family N-acetyltransferase [Paenibacillus hemerocallicola]
MNVVYVNNPEQLAQCLQLRSEVFVVEQKVPAELEIDELDSLESPCRHILVLDEGEPVAAARMKAYDPQTAKMQRVAVKRERRGSGCGRIVMDALERLAVERGFAYSILDAQLQAQPFYERLGYEVVSEEPFYDAGILHVRMRKRLTDRL